MQIIKERVLCVVDDGGDCASLVGTLSVFEVTTATTVEEALALASRRRFDMYRIAKALPDGTGAELCRRIREFDPHTPILFLTESGGDWDDPREAESAGSQGFFIRGGSHEGLADTVSRLLRSQADGGGTLPM